MQQYYSTPRTAQAYRTAEPVQYPAQSTQRLHRPIQDLGQPAGQFQTRSAPIQDSPVAAQEQIAATQQGLGPVEQGPQLSGLRQPAENRSQPVAQQFTPMQRAVSGTGVNRAFAARKEGQALTGGIQPVHTGQQMVQGQAAQGAAVQGTSPGQGVQGGQFVQGESYGSELQQRFLTGLPSVDMYETADEITIVADFPGCQDDNVELLANDNTITLLSRREDDEMAEDAQLIQQERPNKFERTIALPTVADPDSAEATHVDGVCRITLPKPEEARQKRIGFQ